MSKYFALILFRRRYEIEDCPKEKGMEWVASNPRYFDNPTIALEMYANTPCPASQLVEADTKEDLQKEIQQMINNYKDEDWLEKNLYPYI